MWNLLLSNWEINCFGKLQSEHKALHLIFDQYKTKSIIIGEKKLFFLKKKSININSTDAKEINNCKLEYAQYIRINHVNYNTANIFFKQQSDLNTRAGG